jgi:hypothetical protein
MPAEPFVLDGDEIPHREMQSRKCESADPVQIAIFGGLSFLIEDENVNEVRGSGFGGLLAGDPRKAKNAAIYGEYVQSSNGVG